MVDWRMKIMSMGMYKINSCRNVGLHVSYFMFVWVDTNPVPFEISTKIKMWNLDLTKDIVYTSWHQSSTIWDLYQNQDVEP